MYYYAWLNSRGYVVKTIKSETELNNESYKPISEDEYDRVRTGWRWLDNTWIETEKIIPVPSETAVVNPIEQLRADLEYMAIMTGVEL